MDRFKTKLTSSLLYEMINYQEAQFLLQYNRERPHHSIPQGFGESGQTSQSL